MKNLATVPSSQLAHQLTTAYSMILYKIFTISSFLDALALLGKDPSLIYRYKNNTNQQQKKNRLLGYLESWGVPAFTLEPGTPSLRRRPLGVSTPSLVSILQSNSTYLVKYHPPLSPVTENLFSFHKTSQLTFSTGILSLFAGSF